MPLRRMGRLVALVATCSAVASGTGAMLVPGDTTESIPFQDLDRQFLLHVPASYDGTTAVALVLDFHAFHSSAAWQRAVSGWVAISDREGFLLAHPIGLNAAWSAGICCGNTDTDDVGFTRAVVDTIAARGNVDRRRVYATGLSNGGAMAHRLACDAADLFAATAPMAFPVPVSTCHPSRAIPVLTFLGLNDVLVRYGGGIFPSAQDTMAFWHDVNGCRGEVPDDVIVRNESRCETFTRCAGSANAGLCSITAHTFGGTMLDGHILYLNDDFVLADVAWDFLRRFARPKHVRQTIAGDVVGKARLKGGNDIPSERPVAWTLGIGDGTWWATDDQGLAIGGAVRGRGARRLLTLSHAGLASLLRVAGAAHTGDPAALISTRGGEPVLKASLRLHGRRTRVRATFPVAFMGGDAGAYRLELSGSLSASAAVSVGPVPARRAPAVPRPPAP